MFNVSNLQAVQSNFFNQALQLTGEWKGHLVKALGPLSQEIFSKSGLRIGVIASTNLVFFALLNKIENRLAKVGQKPGEKESKLRKALNVVVINCAVTTGITYGLNLLLSKTSGGSMAPRLMLAISTLATLARLIISALSKNESAMTGLQGSSSTAVSNNPTGVNNPAVEAAKALLKSADTEKFADLVAIIGQVNDQNLEAAKAHINNVPNVNIPGPNDMIGPDNEAMINAHVILPNPNEAVVDVNVAVNHPNLANHPAPVPAEENEVIGPVIDAAMMNAIVNNPNLNNPDDAVNHPNVANHPAPVPMDANGVIGPVIDEVVMNVNINNANPIDVVGEANVAVNNPNIANNLPLAAGAHAVINMDAAAAIVNV